MSARTGIPAGVLGDAYRVHRQRPRHDPPDPRIGSQVSKEDAKRRVPRELVISQRQHERRRRLLQPPGEDPHHVKRRRIRPMRVLDRRDRRPPRGECRQQGPRKPAAVRRLKLRSVPGPSSLRKLAHRPERLGHRHRLTPPNKDRDADCLSRSTRSNEVFPIPASARTRTTPPEPPRAASTAAARTPTSASRSSNRSTRAIVTTRNASGLGSARPPRSRPHEPTAPPAGAIPADPPGIADGFTGGQPVRHHPNGVTRTHVRDNTLAGARYEQGEATGVFGTSACGRGAAHSARCALAAGPVRIDRQTIVPGEQPRAITCRTRGC